MEVRTSRIGGKKGRMKMFGSSLKRTVIAISAALAMSSVTVGAAIGPVQAGVPHIATAARA